MSPKELPKPELNLEVRIPPELVKEFRRDLRIVIRHPWIIGMPVPHELITGQLKEIVGNNEVFIVPEFQFK